MVTLARLSVDRQSRNSEDETDKGKEEAMGIMHDYHVKPVGVGRNEYFLPELNNFGLYEVGSLEYIASEMAWKGLYYPYTYLNDDDKEEPGDPENKCDYAKSCELDYWDHGHEFYEVLEAVLWNPKNFVIPEEGRAYYSEQELKLVEAFQRKLLTLPEETELTGFDYYNKWTVFFFRTLRCEEFGRMTDNSWCPEERITKWQMQAPIHQSFAWKRQIMHCPPASPLSKLPPNLA